MQDHADLAVSDLFLQKDASGIQTVTRNNMTMVLGYSLPCAAFSDWAKTAHSHRRMCTT